VDQEKPFVPFPRKRKGSFLQSYVRVWGWMPTSHRRRSRTQTAGLSVKLGNLSRFPATAESMQEDLYLRGLHLKRKGGCPKAEKYRCGAIFYYFCGLHTLVRVYFLCPGILGGGVPSRTRNQAAVFSAVSWRRLRQREAPRNSIAGRRFRMNRLHLPAPASTRVLPQFFQPAFRPPSRSRLPRRGAERWPERVEFTAKRPGRILSRRLLSVSGPRQESAQGQPYVPLYTEKGGPQRCRRPWASRNQS